MIHRLLEIWTDVTLDGGWTVCLVWTPWFDDGFRSVRELVLGFHDGMQIREVAGTVLDIASINKAMY